MPGNSIYAATKAAIKAFTESLYTEFLNTNVNVSTIIPGVVKTKLLENSGVEGSIPDKGPFLSPQQAAKILIRGIEKEKPRILLGKDVKAIDKFTRLIPIQMLKIMRKLVARAH